VDLQPGGDLGVQVVEEAMKLAAVLPSRSVA
jgi:hypothetical protein